MLTVGWNIKHMIVLISTLNNASPEIMERKNSMYIYPICAAKIMFIFYSHIGVSFFKGTLNNASPV